MPTYHERYAARLRVFVQSWPGKSLADVSYMSGVKLDPKAGRVVGRMPVS